MNVAITPTTMVAISDFNMIGIPAIGRGEPAENRPAMKRSMQFGKGPLFRPGLIDQSRSYQLREELGKIAAQGRDLPEERTADVRKLFLGHQKHGLDGGI